MGLDRARLADTATVHRDATIGQGVLIWDLSQIREGAQIGAGTVIGRNVYIDHHVRVGASCKIQNNALVYFPAVVEDGVFIGPGAILTNDPNPRAVGPDGEPKGSDDWVATGVTVGRGAAIGAGAVVLGGVAIGAWALVGAGAVVIRDVAAHSVVVGNPGRHTGWVGRSGRRLLEEDDHLVDPGDGSSYRIVDGGIEVLS